MSHGISNFQKSILDAIQLISNEDGKSQLKDVSKEILRRYGRSHAMLNSFYRALKNLEDRKLIVRDRSKGKMKQIIWVVEKKTGSDLSLISK